MSQESAGRGKERRRRLGLQVAVGVPLDMPRESQAHPGSRPGRLGSPLGAGHLESYCPGADELGVSATEGTTRAVELQHTAVDRKVERRGHSSGG